MLTPPTGYTVAQYWNAIRAGNRTHVRLTWTTSGTVLTDEDINSSGALQLSDMMNGDTNLTIGKAVMKELHLVIFNSNKIQTLSWTDEFTMEMGVEINNATRWVTIGKFTGSRPEKVTTVDVIYFTAYDRMQKFDVLADDFFKNLTYPKTLSQIYQALCTFVGVEYAAGNELPNIMSRTFTDAPVVTTGHTCRDALEWIAEACGCCAKINSSGKCQMVWYSDHTSYALTGNDEFQADSFDMDGNDLSVFSYNSVVLKQTEDDVGVSYPVGMNKQSYLIVDNPFLVYTQASDRTNYIAPIYNRLNSFGGYLPAKIQCVGNWLVESGDIITVTANGTTFALPIFCKVMFWNGSVTDTYEATGSIDRDPITAEKKEKLTQGSKYHKFVVDIDQIYSEIGDIDGQMSAIEQTVDSISTEVGKKSEVTYSETPPENPKVGDLWCRLIDWGYIKSHYTWGQLKNMKWIGILNKTLFVWNGTAWVPTDEAFTYSMSSRISQTADRIQLEVNRATAAEGNLSSKIEMTAERITLAVEGKYDIQSGIDITAEGITISGGKYVKIESDGVFEVDTTNFKIDSTNKIMRSGDCVLTQDGLLCYIDEANGKFASYYFIGGTDPGASFGFNDTTNQIYSSVTITGTGLLPSFSSTSQPSLGTLGNPWGHVMAYAYDTPSSRKRKHDITDIKEVGSILDKLKPVSFVYNTDEQKRTQFGLIHEDTVGILPEICSGSKDDDSDKKSINYIALVPLLLKEIQSLRKRVATLES